MDHHIFFSDSDTFLNQDFLCFLHHPDDLTPPCLMPIEEWQTAPWEKCSTSGSQRETRRNLLTTSSKLVVEFWLALILSFTRINVPKELSSLCKVTLMGDIQLEPSNTKLRCFTLICSYIYSQECHCRH